MVRSFSLGCSLLVACLSALAGETSAARPTPKPAVRECAPPAQGYLGEKLAFWQRRLKLDDWKITIIMSRAKDLKPKTLGNIHWDADTKSATIRVLAASEYQLACPAMLDDMEFTVVHELVHLELSSLPRSQASRSEEEHAVNRITEALLALERRNNGPAPAGN